MALIDPNIAKSAATAAGKSNGISTMVGGLSNKLMDKVGSAKTALGSVVDTAKTGITARLSAAGLLPGGAPATNDTGNATNGAAQTSDDWRVRISVGETSGIFYKNINAGILAPLAITNGVVFPYTPAITLSYQNNYQPMGVTHSINTAQAYQNSDVSSISITGEFTAQTPKEAEYVLAVIHFFKSASKMYFGDADNKNNIGAPPPVLFLNGFGEHYFPNVSVLLQSFTHTMADDVDFIYGNVFNRTRVPTRSTIQLTLVPQYSRTRTASFNLDAFARGDLINGKGNFI
jgi:hypothetical protein